MIVLRTLPRAAAALVLFLVSANAFGATYIVPTDDTIIAQADVIVIASALTSYAERTASGSIETVTPLSVEEVLKGSLPSDTVNVRVPGGRIDDVIHVVAGAPVFAEGERHLVFLTRTRSGAWAPTQFALGKFSFAIDRVGNKLLVRQETDIAGWDLDGRPHFEKRRLAEKFLDFVRATARGEKPKPNYITSNHELNVSSEALDTPQTNAASTSPSSYNMWLDDGGHGYGVRWNVFPTSVTYKHFNTSVNESAAVAAMDAAIAAWNNDAASNVSLLNGGAETGTPLGQHGGSDGKNTVYYEVNLDGAGYSCASGGLLGIGGLRAAGTHPGPAGETFWTITEGDVSMNQNVLSCSTLISSGNLNTTVAHEIGHSLGFRHSDQNRDETGTACTGSTTTFECSSVAVMKASLYSGINATLQEWDQNAVRSVYPAPATAAPAAPTNVVATAGPTGGVLPALGYEVTVAWSSVTGADSYRVFRSEGGGTFALIASPTTTSYVDPNVSVNTAYLYKVRAYNGSESVDSNVDLATVVLFTDATLTSSSTIKAVHVTELRTAVNAVRTLAGLANATFTDASLTGIASKAAHLTELRSNLDAARTALTLAGLSYADTTITAGTTPIRAAQLTELRNGVK